MIRLQQAVNTPLAIGVLVWAISGCTAEEKDPIDQIKDLVPGIEERLNDRDRSGLRRMGTKVFDPDRLLVELFAGNDRDSVDLALSRVQIDGPEATLLITVSSRARAGERRELRLQLRHDGKWKLEGHQIMVPDADSLDGSG